MNPPRALPVALAVLAGCAIGVNIVAWQLDAANDRYSAAVGYDDGRADSLDDAGCQHRYDTGSPLLSAPRPRRVARRLPAPRPRAGRPATSAAMRRRMLRAARTTRMRWRIAAVIVTVAPVGLWFGWALGLYAAPLVIPYGCLAGYAIHHARAPNRIRNWRTHALIDYRLARRKTHTRLAPRSPEDTVPGTPTPHPAPAARSTRVT